GAPPATTVLATSKDDVWIGDALGLWHGTAPGPATTTLKPAAADDAAPPDPSPLATSSAPEGYVVEKIAIDVKVKGAPLTSAKNVVSSRDGVVWLQAWDRILELDAAGHGTTVSTEGRDAWSRWAHPTAKGRGLFLQRDETRGVDRRDEVRRIAG